MTSLNIFKVQHKDFKLLFKIYYLLFFLIVSSVLMSLILTKSIYFKSTATLVDQGNIYTNNSHTIKLLETKQEVAELKIDQIKKTKIIPNISVVKLPKDLKSIKSIQNRKELFIKITLPLIVKENEKLILKNKKVKFLKTNFSKISRKDAIWLNNLMSEYNATTIDSLLIKVDSIPESLALAQAAIESGWGTSRFAFEGNALFGQYIWGTSNEGLVPNERDNDEKYKIKTFNTLRESVESYMKNLNTNFHYNEFRINRFVIRSNKLPLSGVELAEYLYNYSIESDYPSKIIKIIQTNNFEDFENLTIDNQDSEIVSDII
tara:strand:+ start:9018 stop:9974 length:957 start_codon:yes stop_codon:yes gene_type:complete